MIIPLVSIIIPTFNRAYSICETLNSVLAQNFENWECLIVDDGSNDNTVKVIKEFIKNNNRFKFYARPKDRIKGASTCRNIGLENASGKYIQFLDSDDLISKNKIAEQVELLNNNSENVIATCKWGRFERKISDSHIYEDLEVYNDFNDILFFLKALSNSRGYFPIHAYLFNVSIIKKSGFWNEYLTLNDDGEFTARVFCNASKILFSDTAFAYYRWTENSNLSSFNERQKVIDSILSWRLIESYLRIRFKNKNLIYLEKRKKALYVNVKNSFPELLADNSDFFHLETHKNVFQVLKLKIKEFIKYSK